MIESFSGGELKTASYEVPGFEGKGIDAYSNEIVDERGAMVFEEAEDSHLTPTAMGFLNEDAESFHDSGVGVIEGFARGRIFRINAQDHLGQAIEIDVDPIEELHEFVAEQNVCWNLGDEVDFKSFSSSGETVVFEGLEYFPGFTL